MRTAALTVGPLPLGATARRDAMLLAALAAAKLLLHFLFNGRYGYWIDELYFIACGDHLAWGYVDQPPLIAFVARASRLFGDSLFAIRFFPALSGALLVFLTGWLARALGAGRFGQVVAVVCVVIAPVFLAFHNLLTMNAFEPLLWTACAYLVLRIVATGRSTLWLVVGVITGIGVLNKYSMGLFAVSLGASLLLTAERRVLRTPWLWVGALASALIVLPHLLWEQRYGWPSIELLANAKRYQFQPVTPLEFLWGQIQIVHPLTLPIWVAGVIHCLRAEDTRPYRFLGWLFLLVFVGGLLTQAKTYYLAPLYPLAFAAGGVAVERAIAAPRLRAATVGLLLLGGIALAPYALPILPVEIIPRYLELIGIQEVRPERRQVGQIPQLFADMLGWQDMLAAVARIYRNLPPADRDRVAIWGRSYGEAAAIDYFGARVGLPHAISGHQNYYLWGPGNASGSVVITMNISGDALAPWFDRCDLAAVVECEYCMPDRMHVPIHVCRNLKVPMADFWPTVKCWTCAQPEFARAALEK